MKKTEQTQKPDKPTKEVASASATHQPGWFGSMKDKMEIVGDIISPANDEDEWEVLR